MSIQKKTKGDRWKIPVDARRVLEMEYDVCTLPTAETLQRIADELGTTRRRVQVYFQNRRQRSTAKRKNKTDPTPVEDADGSHVVPECPRFASIFEGDDDTPVQPSEPTRSGAIIDTTNSFTGNEININELIASLDSTLLSSVHPSVLATPLANELIPSLVPTSLPSVYPSVLATPLAPDSTNLFRLMAIFHNQYWINEVWNAYFSAILDQTRMNTDADSSSTVSMIRL